MESDDNWLEEYREKYGRYPHTHFCLARSGFIPGCPACEEEQIAERSSDGTSEPGY